MPRALPHHALFSSVNTGFICLLYKQSILPRAIELSQYRGLALTRYAMCFQKKTKKEKRKGKARKQSSAAADSS